eukprot:GGOE01042254.1.p2 GENE.GGOE01042254.1~~GGOE01042254.1.p2  ORF type:complete len:199 (-),score=58.74 GGOE01042254.1:436-978(-)
MPANVVSEWRFNENNTEESLTLFDDGTCKYFYEDDMGDISATGRWIKDGPGHALVECKEEIDGRYPLDAPAIRTVRGSVLPQGRRPDITAAWGMTKDDARHHVEEALTLLQDCTCIYRFCNVQRGVGGEDYRKMGTWMVAKRADGGLSFKVEGIPEAAIVGDLAGPTIASLRGNTLTRSV